MLNVYGIKSEVFSAGAAYTGVNSPNNAECIDIHLPGVWAMVVSDCRKLTMASCLQVNAFAVARSCAVRLADEEIQGVE